jgi:hypothetical protein
MDKFSDIEKKALKERYGKWQELKEQYVRAEELLAQGVKEITVPIDLFLVGRDVPKSLEMFFMNFFKRAMEPRPN